MNSTASKRHLKVAIAAGGTAGHINPALALADELKSRGHEVVFVGQPKRKEGELVAEAGLELIPITVSGFDRSRPWTALTALIRMRLAESSLKKTFEAQGKPDIAIGFGAYVEVPLVRYCAHNHIEYLLHEQNSVPGLANKLSAKQATAVCVSQSCALDAFEGLIGHSTQLVVTGNPVRQSILKADAHEGRAYYQIPDDATLFLIFGGSLGAKHLNEGIAALKDKLLAKEDVYIIHSTGVDDFERTNALLNLTEEEKKRWHVVDYIHNMGNVLSAADLVLSRSGASSIAELAALGKPSILVPYPHATANHQLTNAQALVDTGAAVLILDDEIDTDKFGATILYYLDSAEARSKMAACARGLGQDRAAINLADQVERQAHI